MEAVNHLLTLICSSLFNMASTYTPVAEYQNDHDLLVELKTEFRGMRADIKALGDTNAKISDDHEQRIRWLERRGWLMAGAVVAISTLIGWALTFFK